MPNGADAASSTETEEEPCEQDHSNFSVGTGYYTIADAKEHLFALQGLTCNDCHTKFSRRKEDGGFQPMVKSPVYACNGLKSMNCECVYCSNCFLERQKQFMATEGGRGH